MTGTVSVWAATEEDLYRVREKAELVGGRLKIMEHSGDLPGRASLAIAIALRQYQRATRSGTAYGDGVGFLVQLPHRRSFCPDAAYFVGPRAGMRFLEGALAFAVEVRSKNDYGPTAEREMREKRTDYFAAGTLVVWDVDLLADDIVRVYRGGNPDTPAAVYRRGEVADAEPAVPGWRFPVDELFE